MRRLLSKKVKENKGFTGQDILIAIFLTIAFISLISAMMINLSNTTYEIEKTRQITDVLTKMADQVDKMSFDSFANTKEAKPISEISQLANYEIPENVNITYKVSTEGNTPLKTKSITLIAEYSNKIASNKVDLTLKKQKEVDDTGSPDPDPDPEPSPSQSTTPTPTPTPTPSPTPTPTPTPKPSGSVYQYPYNPPTNVGTVDGEELIPVKFIWTNVPKREGYWVTTTEDDKEWYSYEAGILPLYIKKSTPVKSQSLTLVQKNNTTSNYNVIAQNFGNITLYAWVPKFGGSQSSYEYVVGTSNNKYESTSAGGYLKSSTTVSDYKVNGQNLFADNKKGTLMKYTRDQKIYADQYGWALPSTLLSLFTQDPFNRDVKNN